MLRPARPAGLCLVSEWHVRDIFVPNPNRIHVCVPPPFSGAPGAGGPVAGGGCALLEGGLSAGGGEIFDFSIFVFDGPETRYGVRQLWQNKPHLEKRRFRRVPADSRSFGGTGRGRGRPAPGAVSDPVVHWQMRGRPSQHRARLPPGAAHRREATVVFACSPPPGSQLHDETARQPAHHSKTNELPRDGPQPSSAAACEAGRAVLGLTLRSSR